MSRDLILAIDNGTQSVRALAFDAQGNLYVVDASDPTHEQQLNVTKSVLREIGAEQVPSMLVMNKIDRLSHHQLAIAKKDHPNAVFLSAKSHDDAAELIHIGQAVLHAGGTIDYFIHSTFNVPTLSEAYKYAAYDGLGNLQRATAGSS